MYVGVDGCNPTVKEGKLMAVSDDQLRYLIAHGELVSTAGLNEMLCHFKRVSLLIDKSRERRCEQEREQAREQERKQEREQERSIN